LIEFGLNKMGDGVISLGEKLTHVTTSMPKGKPLKRAGKTTA
jgi:hypothetical protein